MEIQKGVIIDHEAVLHSLPKSKRFTCCVLSCTKVRYNWYPNNSRYLELVFELSRPVQLLLNAMNDLLESKRQTQHPIRKLQFRNNAFWCWKCTQFVVNKIPFECHRRGHAWASSNVLDSSPLQRPRRLLINNSAPFNIGSGEQTEAASFALMNIPSAADALDSVGAAKKVRTWNGRTKTVD